MTSNTEQWQSRWDAALMGNYGTPPLVLASGSGATVTDVDGRVYIDLLGGIAVNLLGHAHPAVVEAVRSQVGTLGHTSNLAAHPLGIELAERLTALVGAGPDSRVLFTNSGAEANEAGLKLSRRLRPGGG
ncbi:MAG: aminotransferase class III-fold pyridoxal phosphate-dependent enzyme, partial [Actinomycetota bacterium]|nr:aminotransferase class III-fold pyridoxal phosphate-dependent enzyme [Actinomycetota bacterium]